MFLAFGTDNIFPVESKRQLILTHMCKHSHQSAMYTAAGLNEPFEASLFCLFHAIQSPAAELFPLSSSLLQMRGEIKGRVREKMQLHLKFSFASLKVPSSSLPDTLQFHLGSFSGPPLPVFTLWPPLCSILSTKLK